MREGKKKTDAVDSFVEKARFWPRAVVVEFALVCETVSSTKGGMQFDTMQEVSARHFFAF